MEEPIYDDGLKWFGEGFDGFPKRLPDDCVEYVVFAVDSTLQNASAIRERLGQVQKASMQLKRKLLKDYIWQRDELELSIHPKIDQSSGDVSNNNQATGPPRLQGRSYFGDSIADEWLIVYLLLELSKQFPTAWMRVYDTDGEFLLIEAANALPKWMNPDIADNRVWINQGHLKIIPLDGGATNKNLDLQSALSFITSSPEKLLIDGETEEAAFRRVAEYPSAISSSLHHAVLPIPRRLAYILHRNPSYVSPAVEAFYLRDRISLKPLGTKDLATLRFAPEDFATVSVKFSKVGYAQLRSQMFDTPPAWTGFIPRLRDEKAAVGLKLTCGFEMLLADPQNQDKRVVREIKLLLDDLDSGEETLPSESELAGWAKLQDDETWLYIDFQDFEKELAGGSVDHRSAQSDQESSRGQGAPENLRRMVSRFRDFLDDDNAGADGVNDEGGDSDESGSDELSDSAEAKEVDAESDADEAKFEQAMRETRAMPSSEIEKSGLLEEARKLALQDAEDGSDLDEDEELQKVMALMEKELKGRGALGANGNQAKGSREAPSSKKGKNTLERPVFGPERPPHMPPKQRKQAASHREDSDEDVGPGDGELSSDDEDYNDVDLTLAKNVLEAFKGQAGMAGPAGNLMRALGVEMPRDEDENA